MAENNSLTSDVNAQVPTTEDILKQVKAFKSEVVKKTKDLSTSSIPGIMNLAITEKQSLESLGKIIAELNTTEQILFDVSIVKMELRSLFADISKDQTQQSKLHRSVQKALNTVGDCHVIVKTRYEYITQVLGTVKSINSNLRVTLKQS